MIDLRDHWPAVEHPGDAWRARAACLGSGPGLFFDGRGAATAVRMCESCPVQGDCLAAVFFEERQLPLADVLGVRGGATEHDRRVWFTSHHDQRELRRVDVAECGTDAGYYRHRDHGEDACAACKAAHAGAQRDRTAARRVPMSSAWGECRPNEPLAMRARSRRPAA